MGYSFEVVHNSSHTYISPFNGKDIIVSFYVISKTFTINGEWIPSTSGKIPLTSGYFDSMNIWRIQPGRVPPSYFIFDGVPFFCAIYFTAMK